MGVIVGIKNRVIAKRTKISLVGTSLLNEVFISFFGLMPFILRKDLLASTFQIALFTMLKPSVAVLSFYWSSRLVRSRISLRNNLVFAGVLARLPFLFLPFFDNVWYMIFASTTYMLFSRAAIPAWMEILKLNLEKSSRDKLFSIGSILGYAEGVAIALFVGSCLDVYQNFWKIFFIISTLLGFIGVYLQLKTPIFLEEGEEEKKSFEFKELIKPWKEGIDLIRRRPDFARFQLGTALGGFGIMLALPALALFYADTLQLSHMEIASGRYIFMGLGYLFFSPLWAKAMQKKSINFLMGFVCLGFAFFPLFITFALWSRIWIYIAFFSYGITQAGSHLLWNLSGPLFAGEEDSSKFTGINVLMVGLRGLIAPLLGGALCAIFTPLAVLLIAFFICLFGGFYMLFKKIRQVEENISYTDRN
jgi:MFS family permease